ncbi:hypothetical protein R1flu_002435 [Riccia fluitans]|uniref:Mitochondrial transcription termination factor n=1 Tax=Riccia fluitans TaxID=41844 RepID=A0ABD1Y652_9MARC
MCRRAWSSLAPSEMNGYVKDLQTCGRFLLWASRRTASWGCFAASCLFAVRRNTVAIKRELNIAISPAPCEWSKGPQPGANRRVSSFLPSKSSSMYFRRIEINPSVQMQVRAYALAEGALPKVADVPPEDVCEDGSEAEYAKTSQLKGVAADALRHYLEKHKGLARKDAEVISTNCPVYVEKIVTAMGVELETDEMVIENWLEKKGVNELEPFLESIGMDPKKLNDVMPLVQVALVGEQGLLKSTEVLESLGVPRRGIWEVLERNKQLLTLTAAEMQAIVDFLQGLGVKRKDMAGLIENSFFVTENLATLKLLEKSGIQKHVTAEILKTDPHGAAIDMPVGNFRERMDFLLACGLSESEVQQSLKLFPQLLHLRLENLKRKIQFFDSIGLEREKMAKIIARWPLVFRQSVERKLRPKIEMLQTLGVGREGIAKILTRYPEITAVSLEDNLKQKVAFFEANGLTGRRLVKLMTSHPRALTLSLTDLNKKLEFFKQKGFVPGSVEMIRALGVCITISTASLEARFLNLESLGFSLEESREIVKQQPAILTVSEKCIQDKVHYLVNHMERSVVDIVKCPSYLLYSLELRIKPRHRVLSMLKSEGLLREEAYSLNTIMIMSEKRFVERFVVQYPLAVAVYKRGVTVSVEVKKPD